jgi:hypothetical protein
MQLIHSAEAVQTVSLTSDAAIAGLFEVMDNLRDILEAENDFLRRGLPAALSDLNARKQQLTDAYADLSRSVVARYADEIMADRTLSQRLLDAGRELRDLSMENMQRLSIAIEATRSRIDAVMAAIRAHDHQTQNYGGKGLPTTSTRSVSSSIQKFRGRDGGYNV